ncbi:MAG TPA: hypothetical protein VJS92_10705, partial [Candidatus Polarisedimenticolaceae bacterium]|nr:hypothetical protein [Candidatus Polarisedimenticolaceae bacterium]
GLLPAAGLALLGGANLFVAHAAWTSELAPRVLGLPYHHCIYELLTDTLALGPAALMAVAGSAGLAWPLALQFGRRCDPETIGAVQRAIYRYCAVALASELWIVAIHAA